MRFFKYVLAPTVAFALAGTGAVNAQCGADVTGMIDQMGRKVRMLAEDVRVEVRDPRGQALAGQAYDMLDQIRHMRAEAREVGPEHMREEAVELDQKFHRFIEGAEALGRQGQYLARSAERVEDLDHELMRILSSPAQPAYTPAQPAPAYQPVPSYYPGSYVPGYQPAPSYYPGSYVPGYQPYPQGTFVIRRGGLTIYLRR